MSNNIKLLRFHVKRFSVVTGEYLGEENIMARDLEGCLNLLGIPFEPIDHEEALKELERSGYYKISKIRETFEGLRENRVQSLLIERIP